MPDLSCSPPRLQQPPTLFCFVARQDTMIRRYVAYLRVRPNVRWIAMAESEDCIEWTERETIVEPDDIEPPDCHEFYGMSSLSYGAEYRVGFLSVFHTVYETWVGQHAIDDRMDNGARVCGDGGRGWTDACTQRVARPASTAVRRRCWRQR